MKILIATGLYPPDIGGPATHATFLEKHFDQQGIVYTTVPYARVRSYPKVFRHFLYTLLLIRLLRSHDGIYALDTVSVGFPAMLASVLLRKPYILRVPGDYAWEQGQQRYGITETLDEYRTRSRRPWQVSVLSKIQSSVARHAAQIVVPSEYMKAVVCEWGVIPSRITRVYTECVPLVVSGSRDSLRITYEYTGFVVTTVARLVPWKGIECCINAVVNLRNKGIPISLVIVGDGILAHTLQEKVRDLHATSYIQFTGAVSHDEVGRRIKASDVFVLNTAYEGLSHLILEAMSLRCPVVTTPVGGNVEIVREDITGTFINFNDTESLSSSLEKLYTDETYRNQLTQNGDEALIPFHRDLLGEQIITLCTNVWKS
jgi:glycosyltransferase involved in cell wall biosynthesis